MRHSGGGLLTFQLPFAAWSARWGAGDLRDEEIEPFLLADRRYAVGLGLSAAGRNQVTSAYHLGRVEQCPS